MASNQGQRRFSWLLLGDIEMGTEQWQDRRPALFLEGFWRDVEKIHMDAGPFDAVFFTGDFVYQGRVSEYGNCSRLLDELFTRLRGLGSRPAMFCVPGNHDLVRSEDTQTLANEPEDSWRQDEIDESFLRRALWTAFGPYDSWASRWRFPRVNLGTVLGDFSAELTKDNFSIGVLGLNTAVNQGGDAAPPWIPVTRRRIESLCGGSVERWAKQCRLRLLLTHHPVWDFRYSDSDWTLPIGSRGFHLHFCGHLNHRSPTPVVIANGLPVIAAPGFSRRAEGEAGYSAGTIDLDELSEMSVWYRVFSEKSGEWRSAHELEEKFVISLPAERVAAPAYVSEVSRPDEPIYVESLHLKDFRCFDQIALRFDHKSRLKGQWTCIAGINGAGKSSVLQALGLVLLGYPLAVELGGERLSRMRRLVDGKRRRAEIQAELRVPEHNRLIELRLELDENGIVSLGSGASSQWQALRSRVVAAYGATRNLSSRIDEYSESADVQRQMTLFEPLRRLAHAEVLLKDPITASPLWMLIDKVLRQVFEDELRVEGGWFEPRFTVGGKDLAGALELPDGFRAAVGWIADLCAIWCEKAPELARNADPAAIQAIVLIDEIDLHLHPALQRKLVPKLRNAMPRVQWIVTTHSPLVLANFDSSEIIALDRNVAGNIWPLDRQILGFKADQIYEWLMGTEPTGEAIDELLGKNEAEGEPTDDEVAELLDTSPKVNDAEARERVQRLRGVIERLKP